MQKPITSRVKRSPLLKYSPAKQTGDGNVEAIGSLTTKGKDKKIEKDPTITDEKVTAAADQCETDASGKIIDTRESCKKLAKMSKEEIEAAEREQGLRTGGEKTCDEGFTLQDGKCVKIEKGKDKTVDTKLYRKDYQDVKEPWEVRRSNRSAKIQGRAQRRAQNKSDRVARQLANLSDDERKPGNKKYDRLMAKQTETTQELENMKMGSENVAEGRRSGRLAGQKIRKTKDKVKTAADYEDPQQIQQAARRQEIAAASGITTSQAEGAPMPGQTSFSGAMETAQGLAKELELSYKPGQYSQGITMKPSAFKMKAKSPATKKLQGAQNTLPQHLQDSIKAAPESPAKIDPMTMMMVANAVKGKSSNKMRSGFKMKGYGKK